MHDTCYCAIYVILLCTHHHTSACRQSNIACSFYYWKLVMKVTKLLDRWHKTEMWVDDNCNHLTCILCTTKHSTPTALIQCRQQCSSIRLHILSNMQRLHIIKYVQLLYCKRSHIFKLIRCKYCMLVMLDKPAHLDWSHVVHIRAFTTNYWCNYQNATSPITVGIHRHSHTGSTGTSLVVDG